MTEIDTLPEVMTVEHFTRGRTNMDRMRAMRITDHELNIVVGALAGCERMSYALDQVEAHRRRMAAIAAAARGPIKGQTVIALPGEEDEAGDAAA